MNDRKAFAPRRLRTLCGRDPSAAQAPPATPVHPGVYRLTVLKREITLVVTKAVAAHPRNALWALFSFEAERMTLGAREYRWRQPDHVPILHEIDRHDPTQGIAMSYTLADFRRDVAREVLPELSPEERLQGLPAEELLRRVPPEERLRGLPSEELLRRVPPEERLRGLTPEDLVQSLDEATREQMRVLLEQLRKG